MNTGTGRAGRGRPRSFDINEALDRAMRLFWRKGYLGTSLTDLTGELGINRASLYAAFGSKEALYRQALERYASGPSAYQRDALEQPTAYRVVERILLGVVEMGANPRNPPGCMWVTGALSCGDPDSSLRKELIAIRGSDEARLIKRFKRAIAEGDLPRGADPVALTKYVGTLNFGLAVQAAAGASPAELRKVVASALRAWPP